jgi:predicted nucleotide-binding protein
LDIKDLNDFLAERIPVGEELLQRSISSQDEFTRWDQEVLVWAAYNSEWIGINLGSAERSKYDAKHNTTSTDYSNWGFEKTWISKYVSGQIAMLRSIEARAPLWAIRQEQAEQQAARQRELEEAARQQQAVRRREAEEAAGREDARVKRVANAPIFIVHGSDTTRAQLVARAVERATDREVVILREQPNGGRTIIEKFEDHAQEASYAIVLITADDQGGPAHKPSRPRGRQNVIFEMGYFYGRIGRKRVCVLLDPGVEQPSDMSGIVYVDFGNDGAWKSELFREMHHAGFQIDWSRIPS